MEAENDSSYIRLKEQILRGWRDSTKELPDNIQAHSTFADELAVCRGLVYKESRLLVPAHASLKILDRIHSSYIALNGSLRRVRETVCWPGFQL